MIARSVGASPGAKINQADYTEVIVHYWAHLSFHAGNIEKFGACWTCYRHQKSLMAPGEYGDIREFKKPRRRRRGQHRLKKDLKFTYESCDTLKSFSLFLTVKTISKFNMERRVKFRI